MAVNLASKYSPQVDERFRLKSLTEAGVNQSYDWAGVATVTVYDIATVAMNDYNRTAGSGRYGTAAELGNTKTDYTLAKDRSFTFIVDQANKTETQGVMEAGKALARQQDEIIVPEIDTYRLAAMATAAVTAGGTATVALTTSNAYANFLKMQEYFADNKVPLANLIAWVSPNFYTLIKQDAGFMLASEIAQNLKINGQVGEIDGVKIVRVPSAYLPANTAFVCASPVATVAPKKLEDYKIHDNPPGINGQLCEGRIIYDAFVLKSKAKAVYTHKIL